MALPANIDPTTPAGSDSPSLGDDQFRALKQSIVDLLGLPSATNITVALTASVAGGLDEVIFRDAAAGATAAGRLRRNGSAITWHDGTSVANLASQPYADLKLPLTGGTLTGGVLAATTANPPAANTLYRESLIKGWVKFTGSTAAVLDSYNVTSVVRDSLGNWTVTWNRDFASAHYAVIGTSQDATPSVIDILAAGPAAGSTQVRASKVSDASAYDPTAVHVVAIGSQ